MTDLEQARAFLDYVALNVQLAERGTEISPDESSLIVMLAGELGKGITITVGDRQVQPGGPVHIVPGDTLNVDPTRLWEAHGIVAAHLVMIAADGVPRDTEEVIEELRSRLVDRET